MDGQYLRRNTLQSQQSYRIVVGFFLILVIIFICIAIAGCTNTSSSSTNLFLIRLHYEAYQHDAVTAGGIANSNAYATLNSNANSTTFDVNVGYFQACSRLNSTADWVCSANSTHLVNSLENASDDYFNTIYTAFMFKNGVTSPYLMVVIVVLVFIELVLTIITTSSLAPVFMYNIMLTSMTFMFLLVAMVWQQTAINAATNVINSIMNGAVRAYRGQAVAGLGWTSVALLLIIVFCMFFMYVQERREVMMDATPIESPKDLPPVMDSPPPPQMVEYDPDIPTEKQPVSYTHSSAPYMRSYNPPAEQMPEVRR